MSKDENWEIISCYTRAQALTDGVLIDISAEAQKYGFKLPTAITANLYHQYLEVPEGLAGAEGQSLDGRMHDLLNMARLAALGSRNESRTSFGTMFLMEPETYETARIILDIGPGDDGEPVLTIMLPEDD